MKIPAAALGLALLSVAPSTRRAAPSDLQFVFTSDAHYGIRRASFRGRDNVDARTVNQALVASMNTLASAAFPSDGGNRAGAAVGAIDAVIEGGDVANREEVLDGVQVQPAAQSWREFLEDYDGGLRLVDSAGRRSALFVIPGNHEASNAVGFYKPMSPASDPSAMEGIYRLMMRPARMPAHFDYDRERVLTSRDLGGVHLAFVHIWPDSHGRDWLDRDLAAVPASTPAFVFAHDEPDVESKHFLNPAAPGAFDASRGFENLLSDVFADGPTKGSEALAEREALERFVAAHPRLVAYFHGNSNWNQFYDWAGPHGTVALHTFRVDSPMKGAVSSRDQTRLSFQVVTVSLAARTVTVRECFWNAHPEAPSLTWGASATVSIAPRPVPARAPTFSGGE
jgi:hypothetical protein